MNSHILFVAPVFFNRLKQRHQAFAIELAKRGYKISFVEPLLAPGFSCSSEAIIPNLTVYRIKIPFKASTYPALQNICSRFAFSLLRKHSNLKVSNTILWLAEPSLADITKHSWSCVLYDRCDLHGAFPGQRRKAWKQYEDLITARADIISISHPFLASEIDKQTLDKVLLVPNARSSEFCRNSRLDSPSNSLFKQKNESFPSNFKDKIKLVSSGAHYEWVDSNWLRMLSELDGVELHIAGAGRGKDYDRLIKSNNVVNHGLLEHNALLNLLLDCNIGLIPFKDIELIKGVDPIKAYEFVACGLEVWAPQIESLRANKMIARFLSTKIEASEALLRYKETPALFDGHVPLWSERLAIIVDRINNIQNTKKLKYENSTCRLLW